MTELSVLEYSLDELRRVVVAIDDTEMDVVSNCEPWTVRRLASHALNNQLFWGGVVTGQQPVSFEETMGAVAYDGDLAQYAGEVVARALAMWHTDGVLTQTHVTPMGELPGSVVINFATIDALAHAWDLSASLGRAHRVRARRAARDLCDRGRHLHRRGSGPRAHPARDRRAGRRHRERTAHDPRGARHPPLNTGRISASPAAQTWSGLAISSWSAPCAAPEPARPPPRPRSTNATPTAMTAPASGPATYTQ